MPHQPKASPHVTAGHSGTVGNPTFKQHRFSNIQSQNQYQQQKQNEIEYIRLLLSTYTCSLFVSKGSLKSKLSLFNGLVVLTCTWLLVL